MATEYDRDGAARDRRTVDGGTSATGIIMGLIIAALVIGFIAFTFIDRTPSGSTVTSPPTSTTAPRTTTPPSNTTTPTTPTPAPSTK
jgi:hypothetical protein